MQQPGGGGGSQYGGAPPELPPFAATGTDPRPHEQQLKLLDPSLGVAEAASPISSRPPAAVAGNFEDLLPVSGSGGLPDDDGDEADRGGGSGGASGNRWPRQETLALLKVRSEMDAVFRDATLKGPLWEDVSRKLAELGYKRSAKKCKEKFENVHKYYKRTKEGRAGRQDGKSYRFFSQLEALQRASPSGTAPPLPPVTAATMPIPTAAPNLVVAPVIPVSIGIGISSPMPISSSIRPPSTISTMPPQLQPPTIGANMVYTQDFSVGMIPKMGGSGTVLPPTAATFGVSFSSDSESESLGSDDMEDDDELEAEEMETEDEPANTRKRKRESSKSSTSKRMMEFFEGLMKQVMQKQEAMQQRFLETIEKREHDRMIREEAWKRQEMARLAREHEIMAQERAISASRDAAIISFLQKITGQTIQLPNPITIPADPPPPPIIIPPPTAPAPAPPPPQRSQQQYQKPQPPQQQQHYQQPPPQQSGEIVRHQSSISTEVVMAVPEQQVPPQDMDGGSGGFEGTSSRWPKTEVLALINLRSGLESRYQEAGPKGPLWEEISAGMHRMGYKRNSKRCKEKWENINKYFKKVKESNKKRPEDAKTCPYFHQLDALYRKKIIGNTGSSSGGSGGGNVLRIESRQDQQLQMQRQQQESMMVDPKLQQMSQVPNPVIDGSEKKDGDNVNLQNSNGGLAATLFGEPSSTAIGGVKNPEDTMKEQHRQNQQEQQLTREDYDKIEELNSDNVDEEEDDDEDDDEEPEEQMKMAYKIQFQPQNTGSSNGGGSGAPSFLAMVQ